MIANNKYPEGFSENKMMRVMVRFLALILLVSLHSFAAEAQGKRPVETPRFEDFPVTAAERFKGKAAPVKLATAEAKRYRTMIREGAREGPNFAGHYTIVEWGCGAGCVQFAIVDARTGVVYVPRFYVGPRAEIKPEADQPDEPLQFQIDSTLLIVSGAPNERNEGMYYYKWNGKQLMLLEKKPFKN